MSYSMSEQQHELPAWAASMREQQHELPTSATSMSEQPDSPSLAIGMTYSDEAWEIYKNVLSVIKIYSKRPRETTHGGTTISTICMGMDTKDNFESSDFKR